MLPDIIVESPLWDETLLERLAHQAWTACLAHLDLDPAPFEVAVLACDDARIAVLNGDFRDKPTPTNVLSWPSEDLAAEHDGDAPERPEPEDDEHHLGDIAIAFETCTREAAQSGKRFEDHVTHLIVHGLLHLLGYDHIRDADATLMEQIEVAILGKMGLPDPYRED